MTSLSKSGLSTSSSRGASQSATAGRQAERHDVAAGGNALPQYRVNEVSPGFAVRDSLDQAVKNAARHARRSGQRLEFSIEEKLNRTLVTVRDRETGEVVRRIPMEEMLALANLLSEVQGPGDDAVLKGIFFDQDT